jgi:hypothetical protein
MYANTVIAISGPAIVKATHGWTCLPDISIIGNIPISPSTLKEAVTTDGSHRQLRNEPNNDITEKNGKSRIMIEACTASHKTKIKDIPFATNNNMKEIGLIFTPLRYIVLTMVIMRKK